MAYFGQLTSKHRNSSLWEEIFSRRTWLFDNVSFYVLQLKENLFIIIFWLSAQKKLASKSTHNTPTKSLNGRNAFFNGVSYSVLLKQKITFVWGKLELFPKRSYFEMKINRLIIEMNFKLKKGVKTNLFLRNNLGRDV